MDEARDARGLADHVREFPGMTSAFADGGRGGKAASAVWLALGCAAAGEGPKMHVERREGTWDANGSLLRGGSRRKAWGTGASRFPSMRLERVGTDGIEVHAACLACDEAAMRAMMVDAAKEAARTLAAAWTARVEDIGAMASEMELAAPMGGQAGMARGDRRG